MLSSQQILVTSSSSQLSGDGDGLHHGHQPDTLRLGCQLSAARDDAEDLRRALTRKDVEVRTLTSERNSFQEEATRLRHDLDVTRRAVNDLTNLKLELTAAREVLQQKLADALEEIARREDQRSAEQAVHQNVVRQQQLSESHLSIMQQRLGVLEAEHSKKMDEMRSELHRSDIFKSCVSREVSAAVSVIERAMLSPEQGSDEAIASDLALLSLVAEPSDVSSHGLEGGVDSSSIASTHLRSHAAREVKSAFHPLYEMSKQLTRHFAEARADKKRLREYQQHQQQHVDAMADDLTHAVQEKAQLLSKVSQCELQLSRLATNHEATLRTSEELAAVQSRRLSSLAAALNCVEDWTVVETQARGTIGKVDLLQSRCREQQEDLAKLKDGFAAQQEDYEQRLLREAERLRQQKDDSVRQARESVLRALEEKDRVSATVDSVKETTVALQLEHDHLRSQYATSLDEIDRLSNALRQSQRDVTQLQAQVSATAHENELLISIQAKQQRAFEAEKVVASRRAQAAAADAMEAAAMSHFEALVVCLKVLHGLRRDVGELCEQRRALCSLVREAEQRSGGSLLVSMDLPARVRILLRFRRAAIAVLAANRLRRLLKPQCREVRCAARRAALRIRLPHDAAVFVMNGLVQRLPDRDVSNCRFITEADIAMPRLPEAANIPSVVSGLLLGIRTGATLPSTTSPSGPLSRLLQDGLHRLLLTSVRSSAGASSQAARAGPGLHVLSSSEDDRRISPSRARRPSAGDMPKSALKSTPRHHHYTAGNTTLQNPVTPPLVSPAPSSRSGQRGFRESRAHSSIGADNISQSYGDDFTLEVLNVIRALDNKVTGALRRPHLALV